MHHIAAWEYWVNEKDRVREILVAEPDESRARHLLQSKLPDAKFLARKAIPESITRLLKVQRGQFLEWHPANRQDQPDPRFGSIPMA